jgi:hypothetical protein
MIENDTHQGFFYDMETVDRNNLTDMAQAYLTKRGFSAFKEVLGLGVLSLEILRAFVVNTILKEYWDELGKKDWNMTDELKVYGQDILSLNSFPGSNN